MRIVDTWKQDGKLFAYCVGKSIDTDFSCEKILFNQKTFNVEALDIQVSLMGEVSVTLRFESASAHDIRVGDFKIVS